MEFILNLDHETFKHINKQANLNRRHASWISFLQEYFFWLNHKSEQCNQIANAPGRCVVLLNTMSM